MEKLFLLDAYALIYRAFYALMRQPRINSKKLNTSAILGFVNTLEDVLQHQKPTHIGVAFDPSGPTFRHELYPPYKAQREETPEDIKRSVPIIKDIIRAYNIPILEVPGFEADDVIGTLATKAGEKGITTYMMTPDKDYGQIVRENVYQFSPKLGDKPEKIYGVDEIKEKFGLDSPIQVIDYLGLMGDASDNIPGCPSVGPKTAVKLLQEYGSIENLLEHTDELKGALQKKVQENVEQIKLSKYLATIRKDVPIELDMDQLKLSEPNDDKLEELFADLEFRNLINRVVKKKINKAKKPTLQLDLFGENAGIYPQMEENGILRKFKNLGVDYQLIDSEDKQRKLVEYLFTTEILSLDTETTSTDAIKADLVGLSFSVKENQAFYVPIPADREQALKIVNLFKPVYEDEKILKVGQNIKYDINVLAHYGVTVRGKMFDTMIAHYVLHPELKHNMDLLAEIYLKYTTTHIDELIGSGKYQLNMRDVPSSVVYLYACEDADVTLKLKNALEKELRKENVEDLFYNIEMPLVPCLAYMERNGARIEPQSIQELSVLFTERANKIEQEIYELAGEEFNIASPKQVGEILFDKLQIIEKVKKTKTGQYSTSEDVLQNLKSKHPIVEKILDYRGYKKLVNTYVDTLPGLINPKTGKIHTSFNQTITVTGRLSSANPNLQNIPIREAEGKEVRKAFLPDEGCLFFSADYSQIELRVMAHMSQDPNLIEAFQSGYDIHAATAAKIYKKDIQDVTKDERRKAKTANFGIIYGISAFGMAERMMIPRGEAKVIIDEYYKTYPGVMNYLEKTKEFAHEKGYVETIFHRKRYLPDINSHTANLRNNAERFAINAPIQGSAADIIKIAMIHIYERFMKENLKSTMILQVHDELNFNVVPEEKEIVEKIVIEEMQNAYPLRVPLIADCGWGSNWLEAH